MSNSSKIGEISAYLFKNQYICINLYIDCEKVFTSVV